MSFQGLAPQLAQVLFGSGLDQKSDARESSPPSLDLCQNIEFDEVSNARTRKPYAPQSLNVIGGGLVTDSGQIRRVVDNDGELVLFTATAIYSWVTSANAWAKRDTYLAVSGTEEDFFAVDGDQTACDRCVLNGIEFVCYVTGAQLYLSARDTTTKAVVASQVQVDITGHGADRARLVALQTKVLLVWYDTSNHRYLMLSIDPANIAGSIVLATVLLNANPAGSMDLVAVPGVDTAVFACGISSTQYLLIKITAALATTSRTVARGADVMIGIAIDPTVGYIQVARVTSTTPTAVVGDRIIFTTLLDSAGINQALGTRVNTAAGNTHITCCYRSVLNGGLYRCYVFWTDYEQYAGYAPGPVLVGFQSYVNWVDTSGAIGVASVFIKDLGIVSRAFDYNGSVYVVGNMSGTAIETLFFPPSNDSTALQNTLFLYRDDGRLVGKANADRSSGPLSTQVLPGITVNGTAYTWCATVRTAVPSSVFGTASYTGRAPCDVTFTFDDNRARRTRRVGKTLYITGSIPMQYDGVSVVELGWPIYPYDIQATVIGTGGQLGNGGYDWKATWKWTNAQGEIDRSTTAAVVSGATGAATGSATILVKPLYYTRKTAFPPSIALEVWRTLVNPGPDAPFYLITSKDPNAGMPNGYAVSDPTVVSTTITDTLSDAAASTRQANPENGTFLESIAPLGATIIAANDTRIFLAGLPGLPHTVWYSKNRNDGEVVQFNDALTIVVPAEGGDITGMEFINRTLVVFRETAIYTFEGDGFDNSSGGSNYVLARIIPNCGAVVAEAIAKLDDGLLFKSANGWYRLDLGWNLSYVGAPIVDFDADDVYGIDVLTKQHQIRITTERRIIIYDTLVRQWGEWTELAVGSTLWNGTHVLISSTTVSPQRTDFVGVTYGWDLEFAWWKPNTLQGRAHVWFVQLLGEWAGALSIRVRVARNYETNILTGWNYNQNEVVPVASSTAGAPLQFKVAPTLKRGEAFKFRFTALAADGVSAPSGDTAKLAGMAISFGLEDGPFQGLSAAQRA